MTSVQGATGLVKDMIIPPLQRFHPGGTSQSPTHHWQPDGTTVHAVPTSLCRLCVSVTHTARPHITQLTAPHIHRLVHSTILKVSGAEEGHTGELAYVLMLELDDAGGAHTAPLEELEGQVHCSRAHIPATNQ